MSRWRRATAVVLALLSVLLGLPTAALAAPDGATAPVAPGTTPQLWAMAEDSATGAVSVGAAAALLVPLMIWRPAAAVRGGTARGEESGGASHSGPV